MKRHTNISRNTSRISRQKRKNRLLASAILIGAAVLCSLLCLLFVSAGAGRHGKGQRQFWKGQEQEKQKTPEELLLAYMDYVAEENYEAMYGMLDVEASGDISKEDFINRNAAIYEGIGINNLNITNVAYNKENETVSFKMTFNTLAGEICFENEACFYKTEDAYKLAWSDALIFPQLLQTDKVRVSVLEAKRGEILDRDGRMLAGWGTAATVGIVPGKLGDKASDIARIAELLEMEQAAVLKKLEAGWVKDDSFVPLRTLPGVKEIDLLSIEADAGMLEEKARQDQLLQIPGVMISETKIREYPYREAAAHLIGYVQNVTAEDLEKHAGEGYTSNSMIGRTGMEGLFEKELRGENGCRIYITDQAGKEKTELAKKEVRHGINLTLSIDARLQEYLYEQFQEDKSCSAAIDPGTGEVLALVSTPSYDNNDFIFGMSEEQWNLLNEDENKPLYNRFRQVWCPGSTFKPVIAAIGLETGTLDPMEDFGPEGLSWQKDASWGAYHVTTLHEYAPHVLENALIWSDNIYFAKAALKIGREQLEEHLLKVGFANKIPFEITMANAQFSNEEHIQSEIQLADSGYGQGQVLINPLHLACIYSAFYNNGTMVMPRLTGRPDEKPKAWVADAFSKDTANQVLEGLKKVVNHPDGTGYALHRDDLVLAGKTGTAEIKASKEDTTGTELGWMAVFTADPSALRPILLVSMTEDVKGRGGSGYVVQKVKTVLDHWLDEE
ncbi:MAG: penicillin-binding transpeptidase domain-containing protein [Eubacterium sp.]|nr:penicillin-binding transpeptidase domain-containing protein [Eubacterium sp.]